MPGDEVIVPSLTFVATVNAFALNLIRIVSLIVFVFFLIRIGISPLFALLTLVLCIGIINEVNLTHYYSVYPFFMPFLLLIISLFGICLTFGCHRRIWSTILSGFSIGLFGSFVCNLRSSYYPIILALLCIFVIFTILDLRQNYSFSHVRRIVLPIFLIISFIIGLNLFNRIYIRPLNKLGVTYNLTYHVVAHPLILSLANPQNELSKREGIQWKDAVGLELAKKIDPSVKYLGPNYEKALFVYYCKLWIYYPEEMFAIYINKMKIAGHHLTSQINKALKKYKSLKSTTLRLILYPMHLLPNGIFYLIFFAGLSLVGLVSFKYINLGFAFGLTALAVSGTLLLLESAIIYPYFVITLHNYLLFWIFFCGLLFYQVIVNLLYKFTGIIFLKRSEKQVHQLSVENADEVNG